MRRATSIAFGENQLFPGLFGLSPLSTAHPLVLQHQWVRASSGCYPTFTLAMDRSPGFGSTSSNLAPYSDSVSLRLPYSVKLATERKSLTHYTKGTQSPVQRRAPTVCMHAVSGSVSLPLPGFFSPFPHGTGSLSVDHEYLALEDGPPIFGQDNTCPALLVGALRPPYCFSRTGLSPTMAGLSRAVPLSSKVTRTGCSHFARHYFGNLG